MKVKLEGVFDRVLGGFYCVRGYASLKSLAAVSAPNPAFQTGQNLKLLRYYG